MRIEAVQNERRPYTTKHQLINPNTLRGRKTNENSPTNDIQAYLNHARDDSMRIISENKTLHSILSSASRVKTPTTRRDFWLNEIEVLMFNFSGFSITTIIIIVIFIKYNNKSSYRL